MEKSVRDDEVPYFSTNSRSFDASSLRENSGGVATGNRVSPKPKQQCGDSRDEVVGKLKRRRRRNLREAFLSNLESSLVEEQQSCSSSAASKLNVRTQDEGEVLQLNGLSPDLQDYNSKGITHASGEKWVVKKKDKSRHVASNSGLSSHLGSSFDIRKCSRVSQSCKRQNGSSFLPKEEEEGLTSSNQSKDPGTVPSSEPVMPSQVLARKQEKTTRQQKLVLRNSKKRVSEDQSRLPAEKNNDGKSMNQRKHQKKSKISKQELNVKEESNGHVKMVHEYDEENLEQNAAQMLSSRFDPSCTSHSHSYSRTSYFDDSCKVLRKRNGENTVRRRRHFYEVLSKDVDPYWILSRRIKVFWPLDQTWYFGLLQDYNPSTGLHNVKYDDHDQEWINLKTERFKLLLFPSEFKCKFVGGNKYLTAKQEDGDESVSNSDHGGNIIESEPIISWLARSIHRVKTSSLGILKDKKRSQLSKGSLTDALTYKSTRLSEPAVVSRHTEELISENGSDSLDRRFCICYSRKRLYRKQKGPGNQHAEVNDGSTSLLAFSRTSNLGFLAECVKKKYSVVVFRSEVLRILNFARMAGIYCLHNFIWHCQYGTLVVLWPRIHMEILILDNGTGLRLVSYVGCLMHAIAIMCLILNIFYMPGYCSDTTKLPVTSIGFKVSNAQQRSASHLFSMQLFQQSDQSKWAYLDQKLKHKSISVTKLPLSACTFTNISNFTEKSYLISLAPVFKEGPRKGPLADVIRLDVPQRLRKSAVAILRRANQYNSRSAVCFSKDSIFYLNCHLKFLMKNGATHDTRKFETMTKHDCQESGGKFIDGSFSVSLKPVIRENVTSSDNSDSVSPYWGGAQFVPDQFATMNVSVAEDATSTCSRREVNDNEQNAISPTFSHVSLFPEDILREGTFNGYRKPRTQVSYSLPHERLDIGSKHQNNFQNEYPCKKIRIENNKRVETAPGSPKNSICSLSCEANVLITEGDKGWRHVGAEVVLHFDGKDWKILIKLDGIAQYYYKAHQFMQPGITNRYTHAMMWKGGSDWILEFTQRSQWAIFREMHEECYNCNTRAANLKNIPIPGVRLIEDIDAYDDEMPFIRSSMYFRQIGTEVDIAMDTSRSFYDMDSDDEAWVSKLKQTYERDEREPLYDLEDNFERAIDVLERVSYSRKCESFIEAEIESILADVGPLEISKSIYEFWRRKRQKKGMPLIRQLQPPLWEWYQKQLKEWETPTSKIAASSVNGTQEKRANEKPPMFAFCLKPRGMDISNNYLKQRSHKKMTVAVNQSLYARDQNSLLSFGKRSSGLFSGNEWTSDSLTPHHSPTGFSPRSFGNTGIYSRDSPKSAALGNTRSGRFPNPKISKSSSMRIGHLSSTDREFQMGPAAYNQKTRRSSSCRWSADSHGWIANNQDGSQRQTSDIEEYRLRDASGAAQHATNMAKLKREKAQWLLHKADLALHRAVVALTTAEAMKASERGLDR